MDSKILLAEDEAKIRQLVSSYLVREGFKVIEAADGQQAVDRFEDNEDVVLVMLDVMMPRKDGFDACREIREKSDVPILMLTARDAEQDEVTGFRMGADEYISKPFSPTILQIGNLAVHIENLEQGRPHEQEHHRIADQDHQHRCEQLSPDSPATPATQICIQPSREIGRAHV